MRSLVSIAVLLSALLVAPSALAGPPALEEAVKAWTIAREWLDRARLPRVQDAEAAVTLRDAHGVSVIVRRGGRIVGRGVHLSGDGLALRSAMADALSEIFGAESLVRALDVEGERLARRLTLEIELAGEPVPLLGATVHQAVERVEPGVDGLAMRRGRSFAFAYPGEMLAANSAGRPVTVFTALATDLGLGLGLGLRDLRELRQQEDIEIYRLPVRRLVQPVEGALPVEPLRNAELVLGRAVTRDAIVALLEGMVDRAEMHRTPVFRGGVEVTSGVGPGGDFRGDYRASADDHRTPRAGVFEQALMVWALATSASSPIAAQHRAKARRLAAEALRAAFHDGDPTANATRTLAADHIGAMEPRTVAMLLLALKAMAVDGDEAWPEVRDLLIASLRMAVAEDGVVRLVDETEVPRAASGLDQALVAAALAVMPEADRATAIAATDAAWRSVPEGLRPGLLPWIALAEVALLDAGVERDLGPLLRLRESVLAAQVGFNDMEMAADLHGGIALVGAGVVPNSQGLRPMLALTLLLGDERVTPPVVREAFWTRQLAFTRFLMQLTVMPPFEGMYRQPTRARHGVRMSLWDSDQPVAAQALGMAVLAETLRHWPDG